MAIPNNNTNPGKPFPIKYVRGDLINPAPDILEGEMAARERYGVAQIERRISGEEQPADGEADRLLLKQAGLLPVPDAASAALRIDPGAVIGKPNVDVRALDKILGRAKYSANVYLPGMLYVKALRSPHAHARVTKIDTTKAAAYPGVGAVITFKDVPTGAAIPRPALSAEPAYAGEPIAAIAAETEAIAEEALDLIDVTYEKMPFVLNAADSLKQGAPIVRTSVTTNAVRAPQFSYERGDTARGFAEADLTVEVKVQTSFEQHVALEPHNAVAVWDRDLLTFYAGNQYPHGIAGAVARELNMPLSNVRMIGTDTGGGFGDKTGRLAYHVVTALLAQKTGRPVRWELNRKDVFADANYNYPLTATAKLGLKRDGTITALEGNTAVAVGAYGNSANTDDWESAIRTYRIPNVKVTGVAARTNTVTTGALRSVGEASGVFFSEILFNKAAEALDMDPLEFRLKNIETAGDQVVNLPYSSNGLRESLERGAELFNWKARWKGWKKTKADLTSAQRGLGVVCFTCNKGAAGGAMSAVVSINTDGSVQINTGAADIGGGERTTWMMIVAEAIGVPLETVKINAADSQAGPDTGIVAGSRGTKAIGNAMLAAALDAKQKLLQGVITRLNLRDANDLDIKNGLLFRKSDPGNKDYQLTIGAAANSGTVIIDGQPVSAGGPITGVSRVPTPTGYSQKTFGAGFYEVEVDPGTGFVRVTDAVQVHDVGRAINPQALINQIEGGMMQGINKALSEELEYDPTTGVIVNANLDEYKLHMIDAWPLKHQVDYVEPYDTIGPFGAKGIGEPALLPPGAAINAAIYDAIGVHIDYQPMTPVRVLNAVNAKQA